TTTITITTTTTTATTASTTATTISTTSTSASSISRPRATRYAGRRVILYPSIVIEKQRKDSDSYVVRSDAKSPLETLYFKGWGVKRGASKRKRF
ncbi:PREDICTED: probable serine/threonine-protein kinase atr1, partial [Wasmannia auropunctata]|uniref:probable serine/threonine-protein kinase atr1 n=1 Tax=Wasmannia auropunctata TaxID=64793 RepID=UPI0005F07289